MNYRKVKSSESWDLLSHKHDAEIGTIPIYLQEYTPPTGMDIKTEAAKYALNLVGGKNIGSTAYLNHYAVFLAASQAIVKLMEG